MYESLRKNVYLKSGGKIPKLLGGSTIEEIEALRLWMREMLEYVMRSGKGWNGTDRASWEAFKKTTDYKNGMRLTSDNILWANLGDEESEDGRVNMTSSVVATPAFNTNTLSQSASGVPTFNTNISAPKSKYGLNGTNLQNFEALFMSLKQDAGPLTAAVDELGKSLQAINSMTSGLTGTSGLAVSTVGANNMATVSVDTSGLHSALETVKSDVQAQNESSFNKEQIAGLAGGLAKQAGGAMAGYLGGLQGAQGFQGMMSGIDMIKNGTKAGWAGAIGGAMNMASGIIDEQMLGDKNFSGTSLKIDSMVHGVSGAIAGIVPWGTLAAGIIESVNMATKAGGTTVQGYDVDINSSGYSQAMAHMDDTSSRGLFGIDFGNNKSKLERRNENLRMAMSAALIAEENTFEQDARMNSVENTIMNNQIALAGGLNTSLLAG